MKLNKLDLDNTNNNLNIFDVLSNISKYKINNQTLLNSKETAELLNLKENTLAVWRCSKRESLKYIKVGRLIRYRLSDIEDYIKNNTYSCEVENA